MAIRAFIGLQGSGKTYSMVAMVLSIRGRHPDLDVYTNMCHPDYPDQPGLVLKGKPAVLLQDPMEMMTLKNAIVVIDEMNNWCPSRLWAKFPADLIWRWSQMRKDGLEVFYTTQFVGQVDKTIREHTAEMYVMSSWKLIGFFAAKVYAGMDKRAFLCRQWFRYRPEVRRAYWTNAKIAPAAHLGVKLPEEAMRMRGGKHLINELGPGSELLLLSGPGDCEPVCLHEGCDALWSCIDAGLYPGRPGSKWWDETESALQLQLT